MNDYEGKMLSERTGWSSAEISRRVQGLVVTLGGDADPAHASPAGTNQQARGPSLRDGPA